MFLNCSNSNTGNNERHEPDKAAPAKVSSNLSREQKAVSDKLDALFNQFYKSGIFNGTVLVAKGGKILFKKTLGLSDKKNHELLTDSSMFQLASVSKVITATAVLMLHEREMLDIKKEFKHYFPDFPYEGVTVKDLLDHRSGLPNYLYVLNRELYIPNYQMTNADMYKYLISKRAKRYTKPDYRFNYSNTNYALLGLLVEKISGKAFSQFLKDELFTPLGMKHTATIRDIDLNDAKTTKPYDTRWRPVGRDASDYVLGDKSVYSTAYDMFLFSEALYQNKIIKPETQELAYTAYSKEIKLKNYGLGWRMKDFKDPVKKEVYHNGWWHGYRSSFHRRLRDTLTVIVLSNQLNRAAYHTQKVYEIIDSAAPPATENEDD
ncbi:MAG: beta-lactamase family protein [Bacteroidia bacterium]|nr:beta-lactamase family protein [Bacteroidia bacterium]